METLKTVTTPWDAADYIETPEDVVEFLKTALEENDPALKEAIDVVSGAKGMAARATRGHLARKPFAGTRCRRFGIGDPL